MTRFDRNQRKEISSSLTTPIDERYPVNFYVALRKNCAEARGLSETIRVRRHERRRDNDNTPKNVASAVG